MSEIFDCSDADQRSEGLTAARTAIENGECIVLPTDTVYGIGADAFSPVAVQTLLSAKGRGREMPPPVLIPGRDTVPGLAMDVPSYAGRLMDAFWPGGLTLIFRSQPSLAWDLGDTNGTVGLRVPDDEIARELLSLTGPLAVSSANKTGRPAATTITEAGFALGGFVEVFLDGGTRSDTQPSTILDCTKADPVVLREGAVSLDALREVLGPVELITGLGVSVDPGDPEPMGETFAVAPGDEEPHPDQTPPHLPDDETVFDSADAPPAPESIGEHWDVENTSVTDEAATDRPEVNP
ncbi:L-threonylcarbamoyladenylate synthase [Branchiibius cervicis]|uniref:L-threonylcarbamoyladenylate synthase n=1 Tax=Branchiibius cervicis TaxID=908252 RepID=A0ABW2AQL2_9MICO